MFVVNLLANTKNFTSALPHLLYNLNSNLCTYIAVAVPPVITPPLHTTPEQLHKAAIMSVAFDSTMNATKKQIMLLWGNVEDNVNENRSRDRATYEQQHAAKPPTN